VEAAVVAHPPGALRRWAMAARPKTLPAAVTPVLVGTACAHAVGGFRAGPAAAALAGALLLQIGANLANDVFDFERGADTADRVGPTRVVQSGALSAAAVRAGMAVAFGLALLVGVYLAWVAGPVVVAIGLLSIAGAIAYTAGPYPLGYVGLGDPAVMVFFGFVAVCGTTFVQAGQVPALAWWAAVPVGALITAILVVNNLRDIETDARAGKRTLAVRLGRRGALAEYALLLAAAYAVPVGLVAAGRLSASALVPILSAPLAFALWRRVSRATGRALNPALGGTAGLSLVFGVLFALGIVLGV
jgi:1,4-dihydroxy-2-naphthoate octaprenyltransferase